MRRIPTFVGFLRVTLVFFTAYMVGASAARAGPPTYWQDVRPILRKHCTVCHSERKLAEPELSAGLALDKPELIRKGGKTPVVVPGKPEQSLLVSLLTSKDPKRAMPLDADPLPPETVAIIRNWIAAGAPEGDKPAEDAGALVVPNGPTRIRKLPVSFIAKATVRGAGTISFSLPIGPLPPVAAVAFSPDGRQLAVGVYGRVTVWDLTTARPAKILTNVLGAVNDLKYSPDGKFLAVAGGQPSVRGDLRLFDTKDWKLAASLGGHLDVVSSVSFAPDGKKLVSASFDKTVRLWDVATPAAPKIRHTFTGHSDFVYAVAFSPDGKWYATTSKDRTGRVVEAETGQGKLTFSGMEQEVLAVAVRPDGAQVVTSGLDPQLYWWDAKTAERVLRGGGPSKATHELAFDQAGTFILAAGGDKTVRLFDGKAGSLLQSMSAGSIVFAVAASLDGKRAASGQADGTVKVWKPQQAQLLATLWSGAGPGDVGEWLALSNEGYYTGTEALMVKAVWRAGGKPLADKTVPAQLRDPAIVVKALAGEAIKEPTFGK